MLFKNNTCPQDDVLSIIGLYGRGRLGTPLCGPRSFGEYKLSWGLIYEGSLEILNAVETTDGTYIYSWNFKNKPDWFGRQAKTPYKEIDVKELSSIPYCTGEYLEWQNLLSYSVG